ncbi:MAG: carboxypeptidase-like regulatory domain-containing protein [Bacteroidetes bacterium]|nr:carboxypeptidase-like regulatory domain-containing protein [Bacteroidota bacterium]
MILKYKILLILFILASNICLSQNITINGKVIGNNKEILQYVNIGIKYKNIGTISDENGNFEFITNKSNLNDSLSFSYLGFKELSVKISDIIDKNITEFILKEKPFSLNEITITSKKLTEKKLGTKSYVGFVAGYVRVNNDKNNNIQEFAKELNIKRPSKILDLNINLFNVKIDTAKFRINFYSIKENLPFEKIGTKNILIVHKVVNGWNKFDLKELDLKFENPVFITLEYLPKEFNEQDPFRYSGQMLGKSITRSSSLGDWNVKKGITMAMYVTVSQ